MWNSIVCVCVGTRNLGALVLYVREVFLLHVMEIDIFRLDDETMQRNASAHRWASPSVHRKAPNAIERLIQKGGKNSAVKTTKKKNKQVKEAKANGKNNIVCAMNNANPTRKQFFGLLLLHSRSARFVIRRGKKLSATEKQFISTLRLNVCVCLCMCIDLVEWVSAFGVFRFSGLLLNILLLFDTQARNSLKS